MRAFLTILTVLVFAVGVSADQATYSGKADNALSANPAPGAGLGDGINPMIGAAANNCASVVDLGVLPQPGLYGLPGDTTGGGNDFEYGASACTDMGAGGQDQIWGFQVAANSYWTFMTCYAGYAYAAFDTSIQINDGSGGCPGVEAGCNGDGAGCPGWTSAIDEVFLMGGVQLYAIIDGWSPGTYGSYTLIFAWLRDACEQDADCDDGLGCNGLETCSPAGECLPGEPLCLAYQTCEEPGTCVDPDPCLVWLAGDRGGFGPQFIWGGSENGMKFADDVELEMHGATRELISYSFGWEGYEHWGIEPLGFVYTIDTALYLTEFISCLPWVPYPGTECQFVNDIKPSGTQWGNHLCEPNGGLPTGIELPDNSGLFDNCEIDFWMVGWTDDTQGAGHLTSDTGKYIGELGFEDEIGQDVFARNELDAVTGEVLPSWTLGAWSNGIADFGTGTVCVVPAGGCCYDDGGCSEGTEADCVAAGGTYLGDNSMSDSVACADEDPDGDGFYGACDNCPDDINPNQADCNDDGEGNACEPAEEQDDDGDGTCNGVDGCPNDPAKTAPGQCGCGNPDTDSDFDGVANCLDECPMNPVWQTEPACGCDSTPYENDDDDGDGFENCFDTCAGVDDAVFGPCDDAIPTVSEWGLVIMALLLLAAGKVYFGRRPELG